jgi:hypothetical protein
LHAFASQNKLPSTSYIYKVLNTTIRIDYSYNKCYSQIIRSNILRFFNNCKGFYSIKLDETAIVQKARWSSDNNEIIGFCYNHKDCIKSFSFETHLSVSEIKKKFLEDKIHLAKEALCVTICEVSSSDLVPKPVKVLPVCCKTLPNIGKIIKSVIDIFAEINTEAVMLNVATDGDHYRRKASNHLRTESDNPVFRQMKIFNNKFIFGKYGLNFDVKHLIKRIRGIIISEKRNICLIKRSFSRTNIEVIFPDLKHLLKPNDYQNVPFAVQLLKGICDLTVIIIMMK